MNINQIQEGEISKGVGASKGASNLNLHNYALVILRMDENDWLQVDKDKMAKILNPLKGANPDVERHLTLSTQQNTWMLQNREHLTLQASEKGEKRGKKIVKEVLAFLLNKLEEKGFLQKVLEGDTSDNHAATWLIVESGIKDMDKEENLDLSLNQAQELLTAFKELTIIDEKVSKWIDDMNSLFLFSGNKKVVFKNVKRISRNKLFAQLDLETEEGKSLNINI